MVDRNQFFDVPITWEKYITDFLRLSKDVIDSRWLHPADSKPFILGVYRGGSDPAISITEVLAWHSKRNGKRINYAHGVVFSSSYSSKGEQNDTIELAGIDSAIDQMHYAGSRRILVGDDILDTGATLTAIKDAIENGVDLNRAIERETIPDSSAYWYKFHHPIRTRDYFVRMLLRTSVTAVQNSEVKIATIYTKSERNISGLQPDFSVEDFKSRIIDGERKFPWILFAPSVSDFSDEQLRAYLPIAYKVLVEGN